METRENEERQDETEYHPDNKQILKRNRINYEIAEGLRDEVIRD